ncbi:MAG: glutamate racemase [Kordia sp.]|nr:MAG: glutamate racemase [Kordia sp.]
MANNNPIGVFDSGIGGISIWKEIHQLLPNESSIYLADSINAPYGQKSKQEIIDLCFKNTDLLLNKGCKLIVVACNTATTNAIKQLRATYNIPFIGIEPAIKPAALNSKTKSIGILATKGTLSSELFNNTTELYSENIKIVEQVGVGLVELIEAGYIDSEEMINLLKKYLNPMVKENIDHLVLGCSHYPFLIPIIKKIIPKNISIIDSGKAVAKQVEIILSEQNSLSNNHNILNEFYTNSNTTVIKAILNNKYPVSKQDF